MAPQQHPEAAIPGLDIGGGPDLSGPAAPRTSTRAATRRVIVRYMLRRLAAFPIILFFVVSVTFVLVNLVPNDPARVIGGLNANAQQIATINRALGLNGSVWQRYVRYLDHLVHGNLGTSYFSHQPVWSGVTGRVASTAEIVVPALLLGAILGIGFGCLASYYESRWPEAGIRAAISLIQSLPDFLLGVLLIYFVFYRLHLAPAPVGQLPFSAQTLPHITGAAAIDAILAGQWPTAVVALKQLILPVFTLGVVVSAFIAKVVRGVLTDALRSEFTEFSRACGRRERTTVRYAIATIRAPLVTSLGFVFVVLLGGDAIVETLFSWNGIGQWAINSMLQLDLPVIEGYVLFIALVTQLSYLALDFIVVSIDPRTLHLVGGGAQ